MNSTEGIGSQPVINPLRNIGHPFMHSLSEKIDWDKEKGRELR